MNTPQLLNILSHCIPPSTYFAGVFPKDKIPHSASHYPYCFVANTDPSSESGTHWIAVYCSSPNSFEFFDSHGIEPEVHGFSFPNCTFSSTQLQSYRSSVCGHYCVYYLYYRSRGKTLSQIISKFLKNNYSWNDHQVSRFVHRLARFSHSHSTIDCLCNQCCTCRHHS